MKSSTKTQERPRTTPAPSTGVTVAEEQNTALSQYDAEDLGQGFEDTTAEDFIIPFIRTLQKMSPQADEDNPAYVNGAKAGMFLNTATMELFDGKSGIVVVPVHRTHQFLEFVPRDQGGGLVNVFQPDDEVVRKILAASDKKVGKHETDDGNELIESFSMFALLLKEDGAVEHVVIPFASSQIGVYKKWMTQMDLQRVPAPGGRRAQLAMFAHKFRIVTRFKENKKGAWHSMEISFDGGSAESARMTKEDPTYQEAKLFRAVVVAGKAKANYKGMDSEVAEGGDATSDPDRF